MPTVEELQTEIAALDERRRVVQSLLDAMKAYERVTGHKGNGTAAEDIPKPRVRSIMSDTVAVAIDLMESTQQPVSTAAVVDEMRRRGLPLPSVNTNNTIAARLSNSPRFQGQRGKGYWLAGRPWPSVDDFDDLLNASPPTDGEDN